MRSLWRVRWDRWLAPEASPTGPSASQDTVAPSPVVTSAVAAGAPSLEAPLRRRRPARLDRGPSGEVEWWERFFAPHELPGGVRGSVWPQRPKGYLGPHRSR